MLFTTQHKAVDQILGVKQIQPIVLHSICMFPNMISCSQEAALTAFFLV